MDYNRNGKRILVDFSNRLYIDRKIEASNAIDLSNFIDGSIYYQNILNIVSSKLLQKHLEENNIIIDLNMPKKLKEILDVYNKKMINIIYEDVISENYDMLITDFSSIQFDFVIAQKPIIYYLPDKLEFYAGMHEFRHLKVPFDKAFGDICLEYVDVVDKIINIKYNNFIVNDTFKKEMENFYQGSTNPCSAIYDIVIEK